MGGSACQEPTDLTAEQIADVKGLIQNQLAFSSGGENTPLPQLKTYVDNWLVQENKQWTQTLEKQYATLPAEICTDIVTLMYNSTKVPTWGNNAVATYSKSCTTSASLPSLNDLTKVCKITSPATCTPITAGNNASLICNKGTCTLSVPDATLVLPNDTIITGSLTVDQNLTATNLIASKTVRPNCAPLTLPKPVSPSPS